MKLSATTFAACLACALTALSGCGGDTPPASAPSTPAAPATPEPSAAARSVPPQLPARFTGVLPCADCAGIRHELDLRANHVFVLRMTWLGKAEAVSRDLLGPWSIHEDRVLHLGNPGEDASSWSIQNVNTLEKLDRSGQPIESTLNYQLLREPQYAPLEPQLELRGLYSYLADAALFEECETGWKLPVASEGDNATLETAYTGSRIDPGQPVLVSVRGRIAARPSMEGDAHRDALIVERFGQLWPNETCGARGVTHELEGTRWVLTRLDDESVDFTALDREPFIALAGQEQRVTGFGACNRVIGTFEREGSRISFGQLAVTRMACKHSDFEGRFEQALSAAARWEIDGAHLQLFDANDVVVARFEARNL